MGDFIAALLIGLVGLFLLFSGYFFARIVIPLWGGLWGFMLGASVFTDSSHAFLGTTLGIVSGIVVGLVFAVLAYLYYYAAVVILMGGLGYALAGSFFAWLGISPGLATALIGIAVAVLVGIAAVLTNIPRLTLVVISAFIGSVLVVGATLLMFNQIPIEAFSYTSDEIVISHSWFWSITTLVLAAIGVVTQYATTNKYTFDEWDTKELTPHTHTGTYHHA